MSRKRIASVVLSIAASAVLAISGGALAKATGKAAAQKPLKSPAWTVNGPAIDEASAQGLADSLGLADNGFDPNTNTVGFFDPAFMNIPTNLTGDEGTDESGNQTQADAVDFDALQALTALPKQDAIDAFQGALADNKLEPLDGTARVTRTMNADYSFFDAQFTNPDPGVPESLHIPFATHTWWDISLGTDQIPLIGPGAKVSATFNGDGVATQVQYALRMISQGQNVVLITPAQANKVGVTNVKSQCGVAPMQNVQLRWHEVYYAPPLSMDVQQILPWYQGDGTAQIGDQTVQLRSLLVPAVANSPKASIVGSSKGGTIYARAVARGGTPPYSYQWTSCSGSLDPGQSTEPAVQYQVGGRARSSLERLNLIVTDANGLTAQATRTFTVPVNRGVVRAPSVVLRPTATKAIGPIDVGAETVGTSMGLPGCIPDTTGFVGRMGFGGIPTEFQWYNGNAWEQDFRDPSRPGGDDTNYADHVDETFYCGHANGNGFAFPGNHTTTFLSYPNAYWGNYDLEWLGIAACGPLQSGSPDWWQRWGPAFGGLHLLLGYQTTSFDATGEGFDWANGQLGLFWWQSPMTVLQSWIQMAINNQPSSVWWATMGVFGTGGVTNFNDYFWGKGPTGPDILPSGVAPGYPWHITGYWKISGPS